MMSKTTANISRQGTDMPTTFTITVPRTAVQATLAHLCCNQHHIQHSHSVTAALTVRRIS
jgi:hypothetical protein